MNLSDPRAVCKHGVNLRSRCGQCFAEMFGHHNAGVMVAEGGQPSPYSDPVSHPPHYTSHPSGIECIQITEHMGFCLGNVVKYLFRSDYKGRPVEDTAKALWYLDREIARLEATEEWGETGISDYQVSSLGRARRFSSGRLLTLTPSGRGYLTFSAPKTGGGWTRYYAHRAVAYAFLGPCPAGKEVAHNDGCRQHNRVENLRYATRSENASDILRHGTSTPRKVTTEDIAIIRAANIPCAELAERFGISVSHVYRIQGEAPKVARPLESVVVAEDRECHKNVFRLLAQSRGGYPEHLRQARAYIEREIKRLEGK